MIGDDRISLDRVDSTNTYLLQLLSNAKISEGTLVIAKEQTAGRGQRENKWESDIGLGLTLSFIIYPQCLKASDQFLISEFVSLSLFDLLKSHKQNVKIKWPNDIYIDNKKIAGILIENVIKGMNILNSIVGIGLNLNQKQFGKDLQQATSLYLNTGKEYVPDLILVDLLENLNLRYNELLEGAHDKMHQQYVDALYQFNEIHEYKSDGMTFMAKIVGIEKDGRICLQTQEKKLLKFAFKEVQFL